MKKIIHVIISVLYIIWGVGAPLTFVRELASLDFSSLLSLSSLIGVVTGLVMFFITSLVGGQIAWQPILQAVMAWLYIIW